MSKQAKIYRQAPLWTPGRPRHTPVYPYPYPSFRCLASPNDRPHVSIAAEAAGRNGKNRLPRLLLRFQVNNKIVASSVPLLSVVGHACNINDQTSTAVVGHRSHRPAKAAPQASQTAFDTNFTCYPFFLTIQLVIVSDR